LSSLQSHVSFAALPSYMRSKAGLEMDPDRFRRRKQIISHLPEADSAKRLLQRVATNWDPKKKTPLLGFDCISLDPTQFKELFRRNFGVLLHPRDLGVLVSMYDKRGEERADSAEFLKDFWQIGRDGRERQARRRAQMARKLNARQKERVNERAERRSKIKEVALGEHTQDHVRSAIAKITEARRVAERYVVSRDQGFRQLEEGGVMGPTMFREQLRTLFGVRLTRAEVGGLVSAFNLHRDGMVDAKEFSFRFHALGRDSHAAKEAEGHARNEAARRRKQEQEDALLSKLREQSKCKVNWDFSEAELKRGKKMIAKAACTYDKARLGADVDRIAQMKMDPTAFRAQLLQNFRVRLGPGELGAVFTAFDRDNSKLIDGTELMHEFFRLGREERARTLAEAERHRHRVDRKEMRFRKRLEDRFIEQTAAKARAAWDVVWPTLRYDPFDDDYSMDEHGHVSGTRSASVGSGMASRRRPRENRNGDGSADTGEMPRGPPARRGRPKISASTAEFLAQIRKEEMTIRAMTTQGRRRKHNRRHNSSSGGEESRTEFPRQGGPRLLTPTTASSANNGHYLRSHGSSSRAQTAVARRSGGQTDSEFRHGAGPHHAAIDNPSGDPASPIPTVLQGSRADNGIDDPEADGRASTAASDSTGRGSTARSSRGESRSASAAGLGSTWGQPIF
ncbi:unnamed protein product, partial [Scytosiphon promiscuus]